MVLFFISAKLIKIVLFVCVVDDFFGGCNLPSCEFGKTDKMPARGGVNQSAEHQPEDGARAEGFRNDLERSGRWTSGQHFHSDAFRCAGPAHCILPVFGTEGRAAHGDLQRSELDRILGRLQSSFPVTVAIAAALFRTRS